MHYAEGLRLNCFLALWVVGPPRSARKSLPPDIKFRPISGMARRAVDIVLFGASGFTGEWIAVALARAALDQTTQPHGSFTFALAGRDHARLQTVLQRISREEPRFNTANVPLVIADVKDDASLAAMAGGCRVVINATGPFRFLGEPVVRACVSAGTDYVDITGEPEFVRGGANRLQIRGHPCVPVADGAHGASVRCESACTFLAVHYIYFFAMLRYVTHHADAAAKAAGVLIVSSCGFDSVPSDVGAIYAADRVRELGCVSITN